MIPVIKHVKLVQTGIILWEHTLQYIDNIVWGFFGVNQENRCRYLIEINKL